MSAAASLALGNSKVRSQTVQDFTKSLAAQKASDTVFNPSANRVKRIAEIIEQYDSQGFHRAGTEVDRDSALWLVERIQQLGIEAVLKPFPLSRVDPVQAYIQIGQRRVEGIPVFDGTFTDAKGIQGTLGSLGSEADIALTQITPQLNTPKDKEFQTSRHSGRYKAIVASTHGQRPGLAPINAKDFVSPFGPPVLQVTSEEASWLEEAAKQGKEVVLVAQVRRTDVNAFNVTATLKGQKSNLAPLVVMTPRSGWWNCAGERGGGLACWLTVMEAFSMKKPVRDVMFVATSGHELGEMGLNSFLGQQPTLAQTAKVWLHFGANIGAALGKRSGLFASTEEFDQVAAAAMSKFGAPPDERFPPNSKPYGEAVLIHQRGGHYISLLGVNKLFHHPEDRWPLAVDVDQVTRLATAFANVAIALAGEGNATS